MTNSYTPEQTEATIVKVWDDAENQDGKRPASIKVQLLANGTAKGDAIELNDSNKWTATVGELDKFAAGKEIVYTWSEDEKGMPEDYTLKSNTAEGTVTTLTNSHTPERTEATVKKIWDDANDADGFRPVKITVHLMNGATEVGTAELNAENGWAYTFKNLPSYESGKEIVYTVTEDKVAGYTASIDGLVITNKHTPMGPAKHDPPVMKVITGDKPEVQEKFTFTLTAISNTAGVDPMPMPEGSEGKVKTITIDAGVEYEFGVMSFIVPGTYVYEIAEVDTKLEGYKYDPSVYTLTYEISKSAGKTDAEMVLTTTKDGEVVDIATYSFENEYTAPVIEKTDVTVTKIWDDNNRIASRPQSITVQLYADGEKYGAPVTITAESAGEDGKWTYTYTGLDKYKDGKEIVYTVTEEIIPRYNATIEGLTITNHYVPSRRDRDPDPDPTPDPEPDPTDETDEPIEEPDTPLAPYEEEPDEPIEEEPTPFSPYTGDDRHTGVWGLVSLLSLAGIVAVARKRREEE